MHSSSSREVGVFRLIGMALVLLATVRALGADPTTQTAPAMQGSGSVTRTKAEVEALIDQAGKSKPDWYDSVELKYPDTLDLTWSNEGTPGWEPQKKLGAYMFSVIGSNPRRYREGVRLLHHVVVVNKNNPQKLARSMDALGWAYYDLLQDYPRAVFWWRAAQKAAPGQYRHTLEYARCYYKMGRREMAVELIGNIGRDNTRSAGISRLWAEMGDVDKALPMAEAIARDGRPDVGYLAAGDICRQTGQFQRAMVYYRKVLATTETAGRDFKRSRERAQRNLEGVQVLEALDLSKVKDGTYSGSAIGYITSVDVQVVVKAGRIESVTVTHSRDDRPLSTLTEIPERIIAKQGLKGVDAVSGATITSDAIINATSKALQQGMK